MLRGRLRNIWHSTAPRPCRGSSSLATGGKVAVSVNAIEGGQELIEDVHKMAVPSEVTIF